VTALQRGLIPEKFVGWSSCNCANAVLLAVAAVLTLQCNRVEVLAHPKTPNYVAPILLHMAGGIAMQHDHVGLPLTGSTGEERHLFAHAHSMHITALCTL
jgi:hypothetical protein